MTFTLLSALFSVRQHKVRITDLTDELPVGIIDVEAVRQDAAIFGVNGTPSIISAENPVVPVPGHTRGLFVDAFIVDPVSPLSNPLPACYVGMSGRGSGAWAGGFLYREFPITSGNYIHVRDVRLTSLAPSAPGDDRRDPAGAAAGERVLLDIKAQARNDQAILDFVDALFADPSFERPNLAQQRKEQGENIVFDLQVLYAPALSLDARVLDAVEDEAEDAAEPEEEAEVVAPVPSRGRSTRPAALGRPASSPPEIS
jgi:hypothetical protein